MKKYVKITNVDFIGARETLVAFFCVHKFMLHVDKHVLHLPT